MSGRRGPPPQLASGRLGLLLAPGAGSGRDEPSLVALDRAVAQAGAEAVRMDFPYRKAGRRAPDRLPVLVAAVREEAAALAGRCDRLVLGGRSMGGRTCSVAVAEGLGCDGLVLVSYPLHRPGRPEDLRSGHFPEVGVPTLFVSGTRDPFGSPEEITRAGSGLAGPVSCTWLEGGDHSLRGLEDRVVAAVTDWLASLGLIPARAGGG